MFLLLLYFPNNFFFFDFFFLRIWRSTHVSLPKLTPETRHQYTQARRENRTMFSLRAVQTSGRSLPRRILTYQTSRVSPVAREINPSNATATTTQKRDIHNVVLPWPSTAPEPEIKPLDVEFLHQAAAAAANSHPQIENLQTTTTTTHDPEIFPNQQTTTTKEQKIQNLQTQLKEQSHQLLQQEKDIQRLKTLITQPGFCTQKKWVYECKGCGQVGVGVEMEGKRESRMMELMGSKEGERERWDVL